MALVLGNDNNYHGNLRFIEMLVNPNIFECFRMISLGVR